MPHQQAYHIKFVMGYIKEPKGVDFLVMPNKLIEEDVSAIRFAIFNYRLTNTTNAALRNNDKYSKKVYFKSEQKAV